MGAEEEAPAESLGEPVREEPDEALIRAFEAGNGEGRGGCTRV